MTASEELWGQGRPAGHGRSATVESKRQPPDRRRSQIDPEQPVVL